MSELEISNPKEEGSSVSRVESPLQVTLIAKWGKERITLSHLTPDMTIGQVKEMLTERTGVLPIRQKLIGLAVTNGFKLDDNTFLSSLKPKGSKQTSSSSVEHQFILMGTPEEKIFVDPIDKDDLPDVVDDFDLDFNAGSHEVRNEVQKNRRLF
jgi:hypothetical protein